MCNNKVRGFRGVIESPNFSNEYSQKQDCTWEIEVSKGNKINITFSHFYIGDEVDPCTHSYVEFSYVCISIKFRLY